MVACLWNVWKIDEDDDVDDDDDDGESFLNMSGQKKSAIWGV